MALATAGGVLGGTTEGLATGFATGFAATGGGFVATSAGLPGFGAVAGAGLACPPPKSAAKPPKPAVCGCVNAPV